MSRAGKGASTIRQRWQAGAVVEIPLANNRWSYGQLGENPTVGFFDCAYSKRPPLDEVLQLPLLFKICVYVSAVLRGAWLKVGHADLRQDIGREDYFFKQDIITGRLSLHHSDYAATNWERPAKLSECIGLERAAVWDARHVEERLNAYFDNTEDIWTKSLAIDVAKVPEDQRDR